MDWLKSAESIMNSPGFGSLASVLGNNKKPKAPPSAPPTVIHVQNPIQEGMSKKTMALIAAAAIAILGVAIFAFKKK